MMTRTKEYYEARINKLNQKDPVTNKGIIKKLERQFRALNEKKDN